MTMKRSKWIVLLMSSILLSGGCTPYSNAVTLEYSDSGDYSQTFDDLRLGTARFYELTIPEELKDQVLRISLWTDVYLDGKLQDQILGLASGFDSSMSTGTKWGFLLMDKDQQHKYGKMYAGSGSTGLTELPSILINKDDPFATAWDDAFSEEERIELQVGEAQILGVLRMNTKNRINSFSPNDETALQAEIAFNDTVYVMYAMLEQMDEGEY
ncbi:MULTISPECIES: hypothetical protein [unclassified Paenibacillus]|uniref:Uncharacterized protein n=1 Tax=Paenibacillus provencensis TaxID=441151 RepID=A0ABW3PKP5_9BACL|nr:MULTISPECIES: hypothetical protein [unclassified Paenibacillus]MCM3128968.1 hypothetical protein [Paenibacillus sp. MER 78]SFS50705.1 hypothetical protein SAMN04488601_1011228 [Paenibacillus sp. 453mf]